MIRNRRLGGLVILTLAVALAALAAPNFTGEWKLNLPKSDFGQMPPPTSRVDKVTHEGVNLSVVSKQSREQGDFTSESRAASNRNPRRDHSRMKRVLFDPAGLAMRIDVSQSRD